MPRARKKTRFFRWFRTLPLLALLLTYVASATLAATPTTLVAQVFFPVKYAGAIAESAERHGVDPLLAAAVAKCESGWNESARSDAGAVGLMQVMPGTASTLAAQGEVDGSAFDPSGLSDPRTNIEYGCAYLGVLERELGSDEEVICAYNAGLGAVQSWLEAGGSVPENVSFAETRFYLEKVKAAYEGYKTCYPNGLPAE